MTTDAARPAPAPRTCPSCQREIPYDPGYPLWCPACEWNLRPPEDAVVRDTILESTFRSLHRANTANLFSAMVAERAERPTASASLALAYAIAAAVYLVTVGVLGGLAALIVANIGNILVMMIAGIILYGAWHSRPRRQPPPKAIPREAAPRLYAMVDRVAAEIGVPPVRGLVLTRDFNASYSQRGLRRHQYVELGFPLMAVLTPQERVALVAHELAHGVNGDPGRTVMLGSAIRLLVQWYIILMPTTWWAPGEGIYAIGMLPFRALAFLAATAIGLLIRLMLMLTWRTMQRAEYWADYRASQVSGTDAMRGLLEKLQVDWTLHLILERMGWEEYRRDPRRIAAELVEKLRRLPEHERERLRRVALADDRGVDSTHPPTRHRIAYLESQPAHAPRVAAADEDGAAILEELIASW